jgi:hypothetical protein
MHAGPNYFRNKVELKADLLCWWGSLGSDPVECSWRFQPIEV